MDLYLWMRSTQAIPDPADFAVSEKPNGRYFSLRPQAPKPGPRDYREFHILSAGFKRVVVYNGTLFGELPTGFSTEDNPIFELTGLSDADEIYAAVTWDRRVKADGTSAITTRTIESAEFTPANDVLNGLFYYRLGYVHMAEDNIPVVHQELWGPIDDFPGTAASNYIMPPDYDVTTAQTDYYVLTVTGKGKDTDGADLAPTYDSVRLNKTGFVRFVNDNGNSKAFVRPATISSIGQITYTGPEELALEHVQIDVLVGLRLYGGELQGQYKKVWVMDDEASSPEWVPLITTTASVPDTCP